MNHYNESLNKAQSDITSKTKEAEISTKAMFKLEAQIEIFKEREIMYKEQNTELKNKIAELESRLLDKANNMTRSTQNGNKPKRSRDILG